LPVTKEKEMVAGQKAEGEEAEEKKELSEPVKEKPKETGEEVPPPLPPRRSTRGKTEQKPQGIVTELDNLDLDINEVGYSPSHMSKPEKEKEVGIPSPALLTRLASLSDLIKEDEEEEEKLQKELEQKQKELELKEQEAAQFKPKKNYVCAKCKMQIESGDSYISALKAHWHAACFTCSTCHISLENGYYERDGEPYCVTHFMLLTGMVCAACHQPLNDSYVEIGELRYHEDHFRCSKCNLNLNDLPFRFKDGKVVCLSCI